MIRKRSTSPVRKTPTGKVAKPSTNKLAQRATKGKTNMIGEVTATAPAPKPKTNVNTKANASTQKGKTNNTTNRTLTTENVNLSTVGKDIREKNGNYTVFRPFAQTLTPKQYQDQLVKEAQRRGNWKKKK